MRIFNSFILVILIISCTSNITLECSEKKHVKYVRDQLVKFDCGYTKAENLGDGLLFTVYFLEELSSIKSNVNFGDMYFYDEKSDYTKDLMNWNTWFNANSCNLDSIIVNNLILDIEKSKKEWNVEPEI